uniref:EGF-like domain-containing protein n=2 Tax=Panagrellus redivivus TaxID=6233 RepID=A0A7E4VME0_PANRE
MFLFYFFVILTVESVIFSIPSTTVRDLTAECYKLYCPQYGGPTCYSNSLQRCIGHAVTLPASTTTTTTVKPTSVKTTTKLTTNADVSTVKAPSSAVSTLKAATTVKPTSTTTTKDAETATTTKLTTKAGLTTVKAATTMKLSSTATTKNAGTATSTKLTTKTGMSTVKAGTTVKQLSSVSTAKAATTVKSSSTTTTKNATTTKLTTKLVTTPTTTTFSDIWCPYCQFGTFCTEEYALRCLETTTTKAGMSTIKATTASKPSTMKPTKVVSNMTTIPTTNETDSQTDVTVTANSTETTEKPEGTTSDVFFVTSCCESSINLSTSFAHKEFYPATEPTITVSTETSASTHDVAYDISNTPSMSSNETTESGTVATPTSSATKTVNMSTEQTVSDTTINSTTIGSIETTELNTTYFDSITTTIDIEKSSESTTSSPSTTIESATTAETVIVFSSSNSEETDFTTRAPLEQTSTHYQTSSSDWTTIDNEIASSSMEPSTETTQIETVATSTETSLPSSTTISSMSETPSAETDKPSTMTTPTTLKTDSAMEETESTSPSTVIPTVKMTTAVPALTTKEAKVAESKETTTTAQNTTTVPTQQQDWPTSSKKIVTTTNAQDGVTAFITTTGYCDEFYTSQSINTDTTTVPTTQEDWTVSSEATVTITNAKNGLFDAFIAPGAYCDEIRTSQSTMPDTTTVPTTQQDFTPASETRPTINAQSRITEAFIATGAYCHDFQTSQSTMTVTSTVPTTEQDWTVSSGVIETIINEKNGLIEAFIARGAYCDDYSTSQSIMTVTTTAPTIQKHDLTASPEATVAITNAQSSVAEALIATGAYCDYLQTSQLSMTDTTIVESATTSAASSTYGHWSSTKATRFESERTTMESEKLATTHKTTTTATENRTSISDTTNSSFDRQMTTIESVNDVETTHGTTGNNAPTANLFTILATTLKTTNHVTSQTTTDSKATHRTPKTLTTQDLKLGTAASSTKAGSEATTKTITTKASMVNATHGSSSSFHSSMKLEPTKSRNRVSTVGKPAETRKLDTTTKSLDLKATTSTKTTTLTKSPLTKETTTTPTKTSSTTNEKIPEPTTPPCKCANSGTCDENGQCVCADGYFGSNCDSNMPSSGVAAATTAATVLMAASQSSSSSVKFLWPRYTATTRMPTNPHEFFRLLSTYWLTVALGVNSMFGVPASMDVKNLPKCSMAYLFGTGAFFFSLTAMIFEAGVDALTLAGLRNNAWIRPAERRPRCFPFWFTFSLYCLVGVAPIAIMWLQHWTDCVTPRSCIGSLGYIYGGYDDGIQNASWLQLTMTVGYTFIAVFLGILAILCNKFDVCRCRRRTEAWSINPYLYGREIWPLEANAYLCLIAIQPILFMMVWISYIYVNDMKTTNAQWLNLIMTCIYSLTSTVQTSLTTSQQLSNTVEFFMTAIPERFLHYMPSMNHATLNDKVDIVKAHMLSDHWQKFQSKYETADRKLARFDKIPFGLEEYMYRLWLLDYIRIRDSGKSSETALMSVAKTFLKQKYDLRIISTFHFAQLFGIWSACIKEMDNGNMDKAMIKKSRQILDREMDLSQPPPKVVVNECGNLVTYRKRMPHLAPIYYKPEYLEEDNESSMENGKAKVDLSQPDNNPAIVPRNLVQVYRRDFPASS